MMSPRLAAGLAALLTFGAIGCGAGAPADDSSATAPATAVKVSPNLRGDGTYEVGTDIKAGTWTTVVPAGRHCYWARLRDLSGDVSSIAANGNLDDGAHGRITVKATDKGVELSGGCTWTWSK